MQTAKDGRALDGRFCKGNPGGPGRPRRPDFYTVVAGQAAADGVALESELWEVCKSLISQAKEGNIQAARLLISHLCGDPVSRSDISLSTPASEPLSDAEMAHRIRSIFASAAGRLESEGQLQAAENMRTFAEGRESHDRSGFCEHNVRATESIGRIRGTEAETMKRDTPRSRS
jgi:hypothetical protein